MFFTRPVAVVDHNRVAYGLPGVIKFCPHTTVISAQAQPLYCRLRDSLFGYLTVALPVVNRPVGPI
jgi:hypothetical protein